MSECIIWILCAYGITNIIVVSMFFKPLREKLKDVKFLGKVIVCVMCCGFWIGGFLSLLYNPTAFMCSNPVVGFVLSGALASGTSWPIHSFVARAMVG